MFVATYETSTVILGEVLRTMHILNLLPSEKYHKWFGYVWMFFMITCFRMQSIHGQWRTQKF